MFISHYLQHEGLVLFFENGTSDFIIHGNHLLSYAAS
jgi:hypothetical protein